MTTIAPPPPEATFSAQGLAFVATFMAKHDIRYYLNGVSVRPHPAGGVLLTGTDGHRFGMAYDQRGKASRAFIASVSPGLLQAVRKPRAQHVSVVNGRLTVYAPSSGRGGLDLGGDNIEDFETFIQAGKFEVEGNFPDFDKLLPKSDADVFEGAPGAVRAPYIAHAAMAFESAGKSQGLSMTALRSFAANREGTGLLLYRSDVLPHLLAGVMPMRDGLSQEQALAGVKDFSALAREAFVKKSAS